MAQNDARVLRSVEAAPDSAPTPTEALTQWERRAALRAAARDTRARSVARQIIDAAWDLVQHDGALDFTVKQVAARAGVALRTFYRHFETKDELLLAMLEESIHQAALRYDADSANQPPVERLQHVLMLPFVMPVDDRGRQMYRWRALQRARLAETFPEEVEAALEPYRRVLANVIAAVCETGEASWDDPDRAATIMMHLVFTLTHAVHGGGLAVDPQSLGEDVWQLCWYGLAGPSVRRDSRVP